MVVEPFFCCDGVFFNLFCFEIIKVITTFDSEK
jgi:hypothetical protein